MRTNSHFRSGRLASVAIVVSRNVRPRRIDWQISRLMSVCPRHGSSSQPEIDGRCFPTGNGLFVAVWTAHNLRMHIHLVTCFRTLATGIGPSVEVRRFPIASRRRSCGDGEVLSRGMGTAEVPRQFDRFWLRYGARAKPQQKCHCHQYSSHSRHRYSCRRCLHHHRDQPLPCCSAKQGGLTVRGEPADADVTATNRSDSTEWNGSVSRWWWSSWKSQYSSARYSRSPHLPPRPSPVVH
jgi:hypothetical protein